MGRETLVPAGMSGIPFLTDHISASVREFVPDTGAGEVEEFGIVFDADEAPSEAYGCHARSAAAHEGIQHQVRGICAGDDDA